MPPPADVTRALSKILADAEKSKVKAFDRDQLARLLGIRRRASLVLIRELGGKYEPKRGWNLPKDDLLTWLRSKATQKPEAEAWIEPRDQATLSDDPYISFSSRLFSPKPPKRPRAFGLPKGMTLEPGSPSKLTLEFETIEDLTQKLLAVSLKIYSHADLYRSIIESEQPLGGPFSSRLQVVKTAKKKEFTAGEVG